LYLRWKLHIDLQLQSLYLHISRLIISHKANEYFSFFNHECYITGCVPKKLMVFASRYPGEIKEMEGYGWKGATEGTFDSIHLQY